MQGRIDSDEFADYIAYWNIEPWGEERADLRAGIVAATIANSNPYRKGGPMKPSQFMPFSKENDSRQSAFEMECRLKAFISAHNAALRK